MITGMLDQNVGAKGKKFVPLISRTLFYYENEKA
jgi:hypothetical protein